MFISVHVVHTYSSIDAATTWKKIRFTLSDRSHFHMLDNLLKAAHAFAKRMLR